MKRFFHNPYLLLLAVGAILLNACNSDDGGPGTFVLSPTIQFVDAPGFLSADATVASGTPITVRLSAAKGDNAMNAIEFLQDGVRISDIARISINGTTATSNAPLLSGTEVDAFTWDVSITPHATGTSTYTFSVADASGNADETSIAITIEDAEPAISFDEEGTVVTTDAPATVEIEVNAVSNGVDLATISVWEGADLITDLSRLSFGDVMTNFSANPLVLTGDDITGFTKLVYVRQMTEALSEYTIQIENTSGKTASASFSINTVPPGTAITAEFTGRIFANADGPNPDGGLDLYTGNTVSAFDALATIIDAGIDNAQPAATNWIQKVTGGMGGGVIRELSTAQIDAGFTYAGVTTREEIVAGWDGGVATTDNTTSKIEEGSIFIVNASNDFFLLTCTAVNVTLNDNLDNYEFSVKVAEY